MTDYLYHGSSNSVCCPHCHHYFADEGRRSYKQHAFMIRNAWGDHILVESFIRICANPDCLQPVIYVRYGTSHPSGQGQLIGKEYIPVYEGLAGTKVKGSVMIYPALGGRMFTDVPVAIWQDYDEACKIKELSPKASATLARRCLQHIIRDFWGVSKNRLVDEIDAIKDKITPEVEQALKSIKNLGNIGAHPERDINIIVDIEPGEVDLIINVLEMLFDEWYTARADRQKKLERVKILATQKEETKKKS